MTQHGEKYLRRIIFPAFSNMWLIVIILLFASFFFPLRELVIIIGSRNYSKSPQACRTLLRIQANLNNTKAWFPIVSIPFSNLWRLLQAHQLQRVSPSLSCSAAFLIL